MWFAVQNPDGGPGGRVGGHGQTGHWGLFFWILKKFQKFFNAISKKDLGGVHECTPPPSPCSPMEWTFGQGYGFNYRVSLSDKFWAHKTNIQINKQTNKQTDKQTNRQTNKQKVKNDTNSQV